MGIDLEARLDRVRKLLAMAGSQANEHEASLAATKVAEYLDAHPLPIRWLVRKGIKVRVIPETAMADLREAAAILRVQKESGYGEGFPLHRDKWFFEKARVKAEDSRLALSSGYLYFTVPDYAVFVPVRGVRPEDLYL